MHFPEAVVSPNSIFWVFKPERLHVLFIKSPYVVLAMSCLWSLSRISVVTCVLSRVNYDLTEGFMLRVYSNILWGEFLSLSFLKTRSTEYAVLCYRFCYLFLSVFYHFSIFWYPSFWLRTHLIPCHVSYCSSLAAFKNFLLFPSFGSLRCALDDFVICHA